MSFSRKRSTGSRLRAATVGSMLLIAAVSLTASGPAFGVAKPAPTTGFNAYANGTVVHAHALQVDPTKVADVDEAFSAISMNGGGVKTQIVSEVKS